MYLRLIYLILYIRYNKNKSNLWTDILIGAVCVSTALWRKRTLYDKYQTDNCQNETSMWHKPHTQTQHTTHCATYKQSLKASKRQLTNLYQNKTKLLKHRMHDRKRYLCEVSTFVHILKVKIIVYLVFHVVWNISPIFLL